MSVCLGGKGRDREKKRQRGLGVLIDKENI